MSYRNPNYHKDYYATNREKLLAKSRSNYYENRENVLKRQHMYRRESKYGLTEQEFQSLRMEQKGRCAICKAELLSPHVDHDHVTGKIRGLLCNPCNRGLGFFKDNSDLLQAAFLYLKTILSNNGETHDKLESNRAREDLVQ